MKKLVVVLTVLAALMFGQSNLFAQDSTASAPKEKKTEMSSENKTEKSTNRKSGKMGHKGKKHHKKNVQKQEGAPNQ